MTDNRSGTGDFRDPAVRHDGSSGPRGGWRWTVGAQLEDAGARATVRAMPTPDEMMSAVTDSMAARTGRSLEEWVALVGASGVDPLDQNAVRRWLRDVHGVRQNSQWAIAFAAAEGAGWVRPSAEEYVDGQYVGAKAALRPIFDAVRDAALALGDDVTLEGRSTYVPFVRRRQFAAVAAATSSRVDLGLRFTDPPSSERLESAKAPGAATHKVSLRAVDELDDAVRALLRVAYEQNG
jgi:predicted transport protein